MPLPTLTWVQGALTNNVTSADGLGALTTLKTALDAATHWTVAASNLAATPFWIEVKPTSVDADVSPCRILFAVSEATDIKCGSGSTSPATDWTGNATANFDLIVGGICPNGSLATFNTTAANIKNTGAGQNPYDGTAACRWSGYAEFTATTSNTANNRDIDQLYILESEEILCVILKNLAGPYWWGFTAGAMFDPPTDADGESGTGDRLWGLCAGGMQNTGNIQFDLANDVGSWPNNGASASGNSGTNGVFDPQSVDAKTIRRLKPIDMLLASHTTPYMTSPNGTIVHLSQSFRYDLASQNYVGTFRQIRKGNEAADRTIIQDAGGNDKAYLVSNSTVAADTVAFDNG